MSTFETTLFPSRRGVLRAGLALGTMGTVLHQPRSAQVDAALEAAAVETDPQRRRALYAQFQVLVQADLPELPLSVLRQVTITQRRVRRHTVTIDGIRGNFAETYLLPA